MENIPVLALKQRSASHEVQNSNPSIPGTIPSKALNKLSHDCKNICGSRNIRQGGSKVQLIMFNLFYREGGLNVSRGGVALMIFPGVGGPIVWIVV